MKSPSRIFKSFTVLNFEGVKNLAQSWHFTRRALRICWSFESCVAGLRAVWELTRLTMKMLLNIFESRTNGGWEKTEKIFSLITQAIFSVSQKRSLSPEENEHEATMWTQVIHGTNVNSWCVITRTFNPTEPRYQADVLHFQAGKSERNDKLPMKSRLGDKTSAKSRPKIQIISEFWGRKWDFNLQWLVISRNMACWKVSWIPKRSMETFTIFLFL